MMRYDLAELNVTAWPRWATMWLLAFVIFCVCKWLTWNRRSLRNPVSRTRHLGYLLLWPGLDVDAFLATSTTTKLPTNSEWRFATLKFILGLGICFGIVPLLPEKFPYLVGWIGMIGIVFVLHFGLFHLLSCGWRSFGVDAKPLMNWPIASKSVSEFWGRRWNTAFRDLTHRFLFRPLTAQLGGKWAVFVGFLFSGIVHDAVISLPAGGGYGGPTLYFLIQGVSLLVERSGYGKSLGLGTGWRGRLFTLLVLLGPAVLLFHPPFVVGIVVPFLATLGAI